MNAILFVMERPKDIDTRGLQAWREAIATLDKSPKKTEAIDTIAPHIWLIPVKEGMPFLGLAIQAAGTGLVYRMLFLKKEPQWVRSSDSV